MTSKVWRMASVRVPWVTGNRDGFLGTPKEVSSNRGYRRGALKGTSQVWEVSSWYFRPVARLGWIQAVVGFAGWEGGHLHSLRRRKRLFVFTNRENKVRLGWGWGMGVDLEAGELSKACMNEWMADRAKQRGLGVLGEEASSWVSWRWEKRVSDSGGQIKIPYIALGNLSDPWRAGSLQVPGEKVKTSLRSLGMWKAKGLGWGQEGRGGGIMVQGW